VSAISSNLQPPPNNGHMSDPHTHTGTRCLVWWWILDVTAVGVLDDIGCRQNNLSRPNNRPTNRPTNQQPSHRCKEFPNLRVKIRLASCLILAVIVASMSAICRCRPPPPNSGHLSDASNTSNIVHCFLCQPTKQPANRPTNQQPSNHCKGCPNTRVKIPLVRWWILAVIVASRGIVRGVVMSHF